MKSKPSGISTPHRQMYDAADAFDDMANHINPVETDSLDNEQILNHAKKAKL